MIILHSLQLRYNGVAYWKAEEELPKKQINSYKEYKNDILEKNSDKSKKYIDDIVKKTENIILVSSK